MHSNEGKFYETKYDPVQTEFLFISHLNIAAIFAELFITLKWNKQTNILKIINEEYIEIPKINSKGNRTSGKSFKSAVLPVFGVVLDIYLKNEACNIISHNGSHKDILGP